MEGNYPIIIDGEEKGSCTVKREGGYTVFSLDCGMVEGVIRLSVYGGDREGYLGVPVPRNGRMWLEKRLSHAAMRVFPEKIDCVSLAGGMAMPVMEMKPEEKPEIEIPKEPEMEKPCEEPCREEEKCGDICEEEKEEKPCEEECEKPCDNEDGPFWYASADGALVSFDGERELVALPVDDGRVPKNIPGQPRVIEGKEYLVYISKMTID